MSGLFKLFSITLTAALLSACGGQPDDADVVPAQGENSPAVIAQVDTDRIKAAANEPESWLTYGGTYDEQRHSALGQINRDPLPDLGVGWIYETAKPRGAEATPLVVDGVMYASAWSVVYALMPRQE